MSLVCPVGPESNLLDVGPEHCHRLMVNHPILTLEQLEVRHPSSPPSSLSFVRVFPLSHHSHSPSFPPSLPPSLPQAVKDTEFRGWRARTIDMTFPVGTGPQGLQVGREGGREGGREVVVEICVYIYTRSSSLPPSLPPSLPSWSCRRPWTRSASKRPRA